MTLVVTVVRISTTRAIQPKPSWVTTVEGSEALGSNIPVLTATAIVETVPTKVNQTMEKVAPNTGDATAVDGFLV